MKINEKTAGLLLLALIVGSCRSGDPDKEIIGGEARSVKINLLGSEYTDGDVKSSVASLEGSSIGGGSTIQSRSVLLNPSTVVEATLSPTVVGKSVSSQASTKLSLNAVVAGEKLVSGMKFRVIAYTHSNGAYSSHKDYTIGEDGEAMILSDRTAYDIVVYSYGTTTLPEISSGELSNINSASVNYDDSNRDFMYQKVSYTPVKGNNTLNITLRHKLTNITTIVSTANASGDNIESIKNTILSPHYTNGVISLSTGSMSGRTANSNINIEFPDTTPSPTKTALPVFVNGDTGGNATGSFSTEVTLGGAKLETKQLNIPNAFKITPGYKNNLTVTVIKCGAFISPGVWKDFMCHNLGADETADPFTPSASIHGAKYQWGATTGEAGRYISQADDQANSGAIAGWIGSTKSIDSWGAVKTPSDPCPEGYRVPTDDEWNGVIKTNTRENVGSWASNVSNYGTAIYFKSPKGVRTLMLPVAGNRNYANGTLSSRGSFTAYWSSTPSSSKGTSFARTFYSSGTFSESKNNPYAYSLRCIAE